MEWWQLPAGDPVRVLWEEWAATPPFMRRPEGPHPDLIAAAEAKRTAPVAAVAPPAAVVPVVQYAPTAVAPPPTVVRAAPPPPVPTAPPPPPPAEPVKPVVLPEAVLIPTIARLVKQLPAGEKAIVADLAPGMMQEARNKAAEQSQRFIVRGLVSEAATAASAAVQGVARSLTPPTALLFPKIEARLAEMAPMGAARGLYVHRVGILSGYIRHYVLSTEAAAVAAAKKAAQEVATQGKPLISVLDSIPWPHEFMKSFILWPESNPGPFFQHIPIWNIQALIGAGYMSRPHEQILKDVGQWMIRNERELEEHYRIRVQAYINALKRKAEREAKKKVLVAKILKLLGAVIGFTVPVVGSVASATIQTAYGIRTAKEMGEEQVKQFKEMNRMLNISDAALDKFRNWIMKNAMRRIDGYSVKVNDEVVATVDDPLEATKAAEAATRQGDLVEIVNNETGTTLGLYLNTGVGIEKVPPQLESKVRSMSKEQVEAMAERAYEEAKKKTGKGFPWEILIPIGLMVL